MRRLTVSEHDDGQRLNRYLARLVPDLPGGLMHKYLRLKRIKLNGKRADAATRLRAGDVLELYIGDEFFTTAPKQPDFMRASRELGVVYEDGDIALLNKPAALLVHEGNGERGQPDTLVNRFLRYLYERGEYDPNEQSSFTPALANRLDRGTSGLVMAAKTPRALRELGRIVKERLVEKKYLCVTADPPPRDGRYTAYLAKDEAKNIASIRREPFDGARKIEASYRTLAKKGGLYLVEADIKTGRTHQIRAHLAYLGAPILGDVKYGDKKINERYRVKRQALAAYKLTFFLDSIPDSPLFYLNNRVFELDDVWFKTRFFDN